MKCQTSNKMSKEQSPLQQNMTTLPRGRNDGLSFRLSPGSSSDEKSSSTSITASPQCPDDERSQSVPKPPSPPNNRSVPERIVNPRRTIESVGATAPGSRLLTDHPHGRNSPAQDIERVVSSYQKLIVSLQTEMRACTEEGILLDGHDSRAEGQACLVKTANGDIFLATIKHNFCIDTNKLSKTLETPVLMDLSVPSSSSPEYHQLDCLPQLRWNAADSDESDDGAFQFNKSDGNPLAAWKYGNELSFLESRRLPPTFLSRVQNGSIATFNPADKDFCCEEGMVVGFLASSPGGVLAGNMKKEIPRAEAYYQPQNRDTFITIGEVTHVGNAHIEYRVNTVTGFSGAPVFLHDPLGEEQHLKLVAIHAGYSTSLESNFGFLVKEELIGEHLA